MKKAEKILEITWLVLSAVQLVLGNYELAILCLVWAVLLELRRK